MRKLLYLLLSSLFLITGCIERKFEDLADIPKTEDYQKYRIIDRNRIGFHFNHQIGNNSVKIETPKDLKVILLDSKYQEVDYFYFLKFNNWFRKLVFNNGIMPINQNETLDCDNFAMLYKSLFGVAGYASKNTLEFAVASVVVYQVNEFGGIPRGGLHMLNLVFTSKNWYIYEPQTGKFIELQNYPNQKYIQYIIL